MNNTITVTLRADLPFDRFYRNPDNTLSVCSEFIQKYFPINSGSITIQARITNPKKKGWKKIFINSLGYVKFSGKKSYIVAHTRLHNYLLSIGFPDTFYIKVSENIV